MFASFVPRRLCRPVTTECTVTPAARKKYPPNESSALFEVHKQFIFTMHPSLVRIELTTFGLEVQRAILCAKGTTDDWSSLTSNDQDPCESDLTCNARLIFAPSPLPLPRDRSSLDQSLKNSTVAASVQPRARARARSC